MFGIGHFPELLIVLVVALIVFGPGKLPEIGRSLGQGIRYFRQSTSELERTFSGAFEEPVTPVPPQTTGSVAAPEAGATLEQPYAYAPTEPAAAPAPPVAEPPVGAPAVPVAPSLETVHPQAQQEQPHAEHHDTPEHSSPVSPVYDNPAPISETPPPLEVPPTLGISAGTLAEPAAETAVSPSTSASVDEASPEGPKPRQRARRARKTTAPGSDYDPTATDGNVALADKPSPVASTGDSSG